MFKFLSQQDLVIKAYIKVVTVQAQNMLQWVWHMLNSGGSRNIRTGGVVEFFGSRDCFAAPLYIPYVSVANVESKIY